MEFVGLSLSFVQTITSLPSAILAVKQLAPNDGRRSAPGAECAYINFINSASAVIYRFRLIADLGVPPQIKGAAWTWPVAIQSQRALIDSTEVLIGAIGRIVALGSSKTLIEARNVTEAIHEIGTNWPAERWPKKVPGLLTGIEIAGERLGNFAHVVRDEMSVTEDNTGKA